MNQAQVTFDFTLQTTNIFATEQEAENFMLSYLETHQDFLKVIVQKFFPQRKVRRKRSLNLTKEAQESLKISLQDVQNGNLTKITDTKVWLNNLMNNV